MAKLASHMYDAHDKAKNIKRAVLNLDNSDSSVPPEIINLAINKANIFEYVPVEPIEIEDDDDDKDDDIEIFLRPGTLLRVKVLKLIQYLNTV